MPRKSCARVCSRWIAASTRRRRPSACPTSSRCAASSCRRRCASSIPPLGNEFIGLIKTTSLASIIGFSDLLRNAQDIYYGNAEVIELLMVAGVLVSRRRLDALGRPSHTGTPLRPRIKQRRKEVTSHLVSAVKVGKSLRRRPSPGGRHIGRQIRRGRLHHRPFWLGQDDIPAMHQPA